MAIFDLYSKRVKQYNNEENDIYSYDEIPQKLKTQIILIFDETINNRFQKYGIFKSDKLKELYSQLHHILKKEYGVFNLGFQFETDEQQIKKFLLKEEITLENSLDIIEIFLRVIDKCLINEYDDKEKVKAKEAINEINERFKENGIGYSYTNGKIIRIDSTYIHNEVTKPALNLLSNKKFAGANDEYLKAHECYKKGENKECLINCCKAFESVMKTICKHKKWDFDDTKDAAKKLIKILLDNKFVPQYYQEQLSSLANLLESGIPTIRNKTSGHGQGDTIKTVDEHIARYALNLTGANIIFLIEQSGIN